MKIGQWTGKELLVERLQQCLETGYRITPGFPCGQVWEGSPEYTTRILQYLRAEFCNLIPMEEIQFGPQLIFTTIGP